MIKSITIDNLQTYSDAYKAEIFLHEKKVLLIFEPDGSAIEETLKFANKLIPNLEEFDDKAKKYLSKECLGIYNTEIRKKDEAKIDKNTFEIQLVLDEISFVGDDFVLFFYKGIAEDFTWVASSSDGENFDEYDILT
ncbi:DUF2262 domain-containing protein [Capnocytophaga felis]|uniref:Uncharacterized protein n=1 Tax=Capnocytophaga felis TaxID=2267611 RepID=A0A5M4B9K8_9FLAO|nr:DUF2262 domain-containing protein [Capnocytophaga felis]GET45972.1 hypothetical protein RCZ01_12740 [Capnocytophaga felis]GET49176.1 hypothetical protein RCZ02_20070 [Capnocytophaga felis]